MQPGRLGAWALLCAAIALLGSLVASPGSAQAVQPLPPSVEPSQRTPAASVGSLQQTPAVESSEQTNDRIRALSASARSAPPHDYVIGSGDVLAIEVFDVPELTREVRVSQTGSIGIPLVPVRLHVSGLTEIQTAAKISEVLQANGLVSHPVVTVTVKERKSKPITVVGAVGHSMVYQADRQVTLVEVLAEAGGISGDAGDTVIISRPETDSPSVQSEPPAIGPDETSAGGTAVSPSFGGGSKSDTAPTRSASPSPASANSVAEPSKTEPPTIDPPPLTNIITVKLGEILEAGNLSNNIVLQPGDVVTVPHAGIVYALGALARPGGFVVSNDRAQLTTLKLLSLAGGLDRTAKPDHAVIVRKDSNGQQREVPLDLKKIMKFQSEDVRLLPSDILYVPKSAAKQALIRTAELSLAIGTGVVIYRLLP
jgi:polysaccharide biosynthesis/export protein